MTFAEKTMPMEIFSDFIYNKLNFDKKVEYFMALKLNSTRCVYG